MMAQQPKALATPADHNSSHGFFTSFPRELRDAVYDLLYQVVKKDGKDVHGLQFRIRTTLPHLRLLCRQFKVEYDEQPTTNNHLTVTDTWAFQFNIAKAPCPSIASRTTKLELSLLACSVQIGEDHEEWCETHNCIVEHRKWVRRFTAELPHLQTVHIRLRVGDGYCCDSALENLDSLLALPRLAELKVERETPSSSDNRDQSALATWTPERGLSKYQVAIDQFQRGI